MSLAARWLARGAAAKAAKVANDQAPEPRSRPQLPQLSHVSRVARIESAEADALEPTGPCPACGCGVGWKPAELPADGPGWRCERCAPPDSVPRHACVVADGDRPERPPLPYPPGWQGWPDEPAPEPGLPDPASAPLGKCRSCRFTAPLSGSGSCGACEHARLLVAAERAVLSPDALADEAELTVRGEPLP